MILKLLLVINFSFPNLPVEVSHLQQTFAPLKLEVTTLTTSYESVPFLYYAEDGQSRVSNSWLDNTILRLATSSDLTAFVIGSNQWKDTNYGGYSHTDRPLITMQADQSFWLQETLDHELSHKLYARAGMKDRTHELVGRYGVGKWQAYMLRDFLTRAEVERKDTILGLANFLVTQYKLGNMESVIWASQELLKYTN